MSAKRDRSYKPKVFPAGRLTRCLAEVANSLFGQECSYSVSLTETLPDGAERTRRSEDGSVAEALCDLRAQKTSLAASFGPKAGGRLGQDSRVYLRAASAGHLDANFQAETIEGVNFLAEIFERTLELEVGQSPKERGASQPNIWDAIDALTRRVEELEASVTRGSPLTAFVSFRFDERGLKYGAQVMAFLERLGLRVISGESYEPKSVSGKVRSRLAGVDIVVVIHAGENSSWLRDEMARAQLPGVYPIPMVEEGTRFEGGIFGDLEYIPFTADHVGDGFLRLLEGVQYVEREKRSPPVVEPG